MRGAVATLSLFLVLGACQSAPKPLTDADKAAARSMDSTYSMAVASGDVAGMVANDAPDVIMQGPGMPQVRGVGKIRSMMQGMSGMKYTLALTQETADGMGDVMYTTGRYHYVGMATDSGPAPTEDGKYLEVWRRGADGKWKLAAQSWNTNTTPAPAPAPAKPAAHRGK